MISQRFLHCAVYWAAFAIVVATLSSSPAKAQIQTGSILGTVTDTSGAVVSDAKVNIVNKATGATVTAKTSGTGVYNSGALIPGNYVVTVEKSGFRKLEMPMTIQVGVVSNGNGQLRPGAATETVEVQATGVQVTTDQATVQGVIVTQQIQNMPINGRNFLDLAQLEPGVQIQDGGNFDPTKNGFTAISVGNREGRTTRIEIDGIDLTDETVGTTTQNVPLGALQEFAIAQSSLDLSTELTGQGAVNIVSKSGTNGYHGEGFGLFRDNRFAADLPGNPPFQRNQYGGSFGGPIVKDKLFFFLDAEHARQAQTTAVQLNAPFQADTGGFPSIFREKMLWGKLDWQISHNVHFFFRSNWDNHRERVNFIQNTFQPFANINNAYIHAAGVDFTTGNFTHSVRGDYLHFRNDISDSVIGSGITDPMPGVAINIGSDPICLTPGADSWCSGPNFLAPQATRQSNKQIKYDGSWLHHSHIIRYGVDFNRIWNGGFASFIGAAPEVNAPNNSGAVPSNVLTYPANTVLIGNGFGFASEIPGFGFPAGALFDHRTGLYVGDSWKAKPNLTITAGLRWVRDFGRSNSDLPAIPCSAAAVPVPNCTGNLLDAIQPGLGGRIRQPNTNFAPQLGFAWDPRSNGRTVIRAGIGLFYENSVFNNILFDRASRLPTGLLLTDSALCDAGNAVNPASFWPAGSPPPAPFPYCGMPLSTPNFAATLDQYQAQYQAATKAAGPQSNSTFIGNSMAEGLLSTFNTLLSPNYRTARSIQMNIGVQHQVWKDAVLTTDYVRNVGLHYMIATDANHVGDIRYFNKGNAMAAIAATNAAFGCGSSTSAAATNCAITNGALISDYAGNGLDSAAELTGGFADPTAAFPGINPAFGQVQMLFPVGRSVYNAMDISLKQNVNSPVPGVRHMFLQVSYSLSKYDTMSVDQDFIENAYDFANMNKYFGPSALDRRHQLSFGAVFDILHGPTVSFTGHFATPFERTLFLPSDGSLGQIFKTDLTGDGTGGGQQYFPTGDILPGTNIGSFGNGVNSGNLNQVITNFNNSVAGSLTPAGQLLVQQGLFTQQQLVALGAVVPSIALAPPGNVGISPLKIFDFKFAWPVRLHESMSIEPSVSIYNLFNFANFDPASQPLSGVLDGSDGSLNGTTNTFTGPTARSNRATLGSGVFALGAPRMIEFGLRVSF